MIKMGTDKFNEERMAAVKLLIAITFFCIALDCQAQKLDGNFTLERRQGQPERVTDSISSNLKQNQEKTSCITQTYPEDTISLNLTHCIYSMILYQGPPVLPILS